MSKNPDWTRDELILLLDLFFRAGRKQLTANHDDVIRLSKLLNRLPIHKLETRDAKFRNAPGISMKLGNLRSIDPQYGGKGLKRGAKLDLEVWNEFSGDPARLRLTAATIAKSGSWAAKASAELSAPWDEYEFPEGRLLTYLHQRKERNRIAVVQKKRKVLQETGKLECQACGFDFFRFYGKLGYSFAECHHTVPMSQLSADHKTRLSDLAIICANCHRMIHMSRPLLSIQELWLMIELNCNG